MGAVVNDLKYAAHRILKQPGFTAIVVISLALGISANTMVFSVIDALLLQSLPYQDPARVMILWFTPPGHPEQRNGATNANCVALKDRTRSFEKLGCAQIYVGLSLSEQNQDAAAAERLIGDIFSLDLAHTLGVKPVIGRWQTPDEEQPGRDLVMLISSRLWQRRFASSPNVIGKKVYVSSQNTPSNAATIIGVLPQGFEFFHPNGDYWYPLVITPDSMRSPNRRLFVAARLKPDVTMAQAQAEMNSVASSLAEEFPTTNKGWGIQVQPIQEAYLGFFRNPLLILQGAVVFVLLIACANVAGLLLAQGAAQHKELAIRSALGSGQFRIIRQLLTGNILLAVIAGIVGLAISWAGMRVLLSSLPAERFPRLDQITIDPLVLGFTLALSLISAFVFGIVPAFQASRQNLVGALTDSTRGSTAGRSRQLLRSGFVVAQISLALVLLIGAGLMISSFLRLYAVQPGFDPKGLMTFQMQLLESKFIKDTGGRTPAGFAETEVNPVLSQTSEEIRERLAAIPGVQSAAMVSTVAPLIGFARIYPFMIDGKQVESAEQEAQSAEWYPLSPNYFETLRLAILRGRVFNSHDSAAGQPVIVINSTMAKRFWPNDDPIGRHIQVTYFNDSPREIIGVVSDVRQNVRQDIRPQMYVPFAQLPRIEQKTQSFGLELLTFIVRASGNAAHLVASFRSAAAEVDRNQPIFNIQLLEQYLSDQLQGFRQYVILLGVFGGIAGILAIIGIYGIMAHSVTQRTNEIGIRMALGATSNKVLQVVLYRGMLLIGIGLLLGFVASVVLTRIIGSLLLGVTATDPTTFAVVVLALGLVGLVACYIPARRAVKIDPAIALRHE